MKDANGADIEVGDYVASVNHPDHMLITKINNPTNAQVKFVLEDYCDNYFAKQAIYLRTFNIESTNLVKIEPEDLI